MEPGKRINDYRSSRGEYTKNVHAKNMPRPDVDLGWRIEADMFEARPADFPVDRCWGNCYG